MPSHIGPRTRRPRTLIALTWLVTLLAALIGYVIPAAAAHYPVVAVTDVAGVPICDRDRPENPPYTDVACNAEGASAYIGSDGVTVTAGLVVAVDPRDTNNGPFSPSIWLVEIRTPAGALLASMGVDGRDDVLYIQCSNSDTPRYAVAASAALASGAITVAADSPAPYHRLTFTVPLSELVPCGVTASTPVRLLFGTSTANNTRDALTINKDLFTTGGVLPPPITFGGTLEMSKAATVVSGPNPPIVGQETIYDLVVTAKNPSAYALDDVSVTDTVPGEVAIQSVTPTAGTASFAGQNVTWNGFGLVAGASRTLTIRVTVTPAPSNVGSPMLLNPGASGTATRIAGGGTVTAVSGPVSTASVLGPGLAVTKTVSPATVGPGDTVTYTVTLANAGTATTTVNSVADTLPAGFTYVATTGGTLGAGAPSVGPGNVVTWTGPPFSVPAGGTRTLLFTATASNTAGTFDNVVVANAVTVGAVSSGPTATVTVVPRADLSITKTDAPDPVVAGDNLTYTIVVSNAGPSAATGVTVTDVLPAGVTFVPASSSAGCNLAAGTVTCDVGTVNVGTPVTLTVVVTTLAAGALSNTASVAATTIDPNPANNRATATTNVQPTTANLSVTKTASPTTAVAGQTLTYTLAVTNAGPGTAPNVTVTDTLPLGLTFNSATSPACGYHAPTRTVTCTAATVATRTGVTFTVVASVDPGQTAPLRNTASVSSAIGDSDIRDNTSTIDTEVISRADLAVTLSDTPDPVVAGNTLIYTVTAINNGPSTATGVRLTTALDPDVSFVGGPDACSYDVVPHAVSCSVGTLDPGPSNSTAFAVTVRVGPDVTGSLTSTATATIPDSITDLVPGNNTDSEDTAVAVVTDLAITKVSSVPTVTPGGTITYTIGVTNNGPSASTGVRITDVLPSGVTFTSAPDCTYDTPSRTLTCDLASLGVGVAFAVRRTVVVAVAPGATSEITNTATVLPSRLLEDPILGNNTATSDVTLAPPSADLIASLAATPNPVVAGQALTVVAGVTNAGPSTATDIVVATTLPTALVPGTLPGGCTLVAPVVRCTVATLAPGASPVSFTIPTTVAAATPAGTALDVGTAVNSLATSDPNLPNNTANARVTVRTDNDLSVSLADTPDPVVAGQLLTYTATVNNTGPSNATGVVLSMILPGGVTLAPAAVPAGCNYVAPALTCDLATLPTGSAPPVIVVVSVDAGTLGVVTATATVTATPPDSVTTNNSASATTTVIAAALPPPLPPPPAPSADLVASLTATPDPVGAGQALDVVAGVTNNGPDTATSVVLTVTLPTALTPGILPSGCAYEAVPDRVVRCRFASLAPHQTARFLLSASGPGAASFAFPAVVAPGTPGGTVLTLTATVFSVIFDPVAPNNLAAASVTVATSPAATAPATPPATTVTTSAPAVVETQVLPSVLTTALRPAAIATVTQPAPLPAPVVVRSAPAFAATLPRTGSRSLSFAAWGLSLVVGGALLTLSGRRRLCGRPVSRESGSPTG